MDNDPDRDYLEPLDGWRVVMFALGLFVGAVGLACLIMWLFPLPIGR